MSISLSSLSRTFLTVSPGCHTSFQEHASHVTMSVTKLLSRIVNPNQVNNDRPDHEVAEQLHDHTFGLTSDPLTQFACILSALVVCFT
mgnify:CR=1 FL=1